MSSSMYPWGKERIRMLKDNSWLFQNFLVYSTIDNHSMGMVYIVHFGLKHSGTKYNQ
jgi:hypothetical protein